MAGCPTKLVKIFANAYDLMKASAHKEKAMKLRILTVLVLSALLSTTAFAQYERTDLVSNQLGVAPTTD